MTSDWENLHKYTGCPLYGIDVDSVNIVRGEWEHYGTTGELIVRWEEKVMFTYYWAATFKEAKDMLLTCISQRIEEAECLVERHEADYCKALELHP